METSIICDWDRIASRVSYHAIRLNSKDELVRIKSQCVLDTVYFTLQDLGIDLTYNSLGYVCIKSLMYGSLPLVVLNADKKDF